tara:strand:- start:1603 stop:2346 length:744 start_codon:yes stop_codon:yes gene_type:complete
MIIISFLKKIILLIIKFCFYFLYLFFISIKIPNNKKYIIYIKIAKTGGSSIVEYFRFNVGVIFLNDFIKLSKSQKYNNKKLIVIVNDQVDYFIENYSEIWNSSYIFSSIRNPISKFKSAYNYHPFCKDKRPIEVIETLKKYESYNIYGWKKNNNYKTIQKISAYNHILYTQYKSLYRNNKKLYHYLIKIEKFDKDFLILIEKLNLKFYYSNIYKKRVNFNKKLIIFTKSEKEIIKKLFHDDYVNFNY